MVDKGFGGRQYQKTTLASNPKRDYMGPIQNVHREKKIIRMKNNDVTISLYTVGKVNKG
jgi:hypothetical protein